MIFKSCSGTLIGLDPTYILLHMKPLFDILKGDKNPTSPHSLTEAGERALQKVETALSQQHSSYCDYERPWGLYILASEHSPTSVLFQDNPLR